VSRRIFALAFVVVMAVSGSRSAAQRGAADADADIVSAVRAAIASQQLARGEELLTKYRATRGTTPEALAALSWLGRGALAAKQFDQAERYAVETHTLALAALKQRRLDDDAHLQTALGAAIEVQALAAAQRGERSQAVSFLRGELETYRDTAIHKRIAKNLNLLSLEGQPALPLDGDEYLDRPVPSLTALKGKVVVLFFWAHWCPDCKAQGPILAKLLDKYSSQGLAIVAPTQRYGYVVAGQRADAPAELRHIVQVRDTHYPFLRNWSVPVSEATHKRYGVSTTPTIVLVDRAGLVRLYRPGRMTEQELESAIQELLRVPSPTARK
jgi:thiol-disulfide isomerase/thioredoxin